MPFYSDPQILQMGKILTLVQFESKHNAYLANMTPNPLSPHDSLKHHFTSLKTDVIFLQPRVLERNLP